MSRPAGSPISWATDGGRRVTPTSGQQAHGWDSTQRPGVLNANALWGIAYDWLVYLAAKISGNRYTYDAAQTLIINTSALGYVINEIATAAPARSFGTPPNIGYTATTGVAHLWCPIEPPQFASGGGYYTFSEFYGTSKCTDVGVTTVSYTFFKYKADGTSAATPIATVTNDGSSGTGWIQDAPTSIGVVYDPAYIYGIGVIISGNAGGDALFCGVTLKMTAPGPV